MRSISTVKRVNYEKPLYKMNSISRMQVALEMLYLCERVSKWIHPSYVFASLSAASPFLFAVLLISLSGWGEQLNMVVTSNSNRSSSGSSTLPALWATLTSLCTPFSCSRTHLKQFDSNSPFDSKALSVILPAAGQMSQANSNTHTLSVSFKS